MDDDYLLIGTAPAVSDYLRLRQESGLTPRSADQGRLALAGTWAACHIRHQPSDETVAMGRLIGDGGWYFHVVDMAVLPEHQRRGLGDAILGALLVFIRHAAPAGAWVTLLADPPGRRLYERHGFAETAPGSVGMAQILDSP